MGRSTCSRILIVFPQTSSPRAKKLCCMCSKTMKQWTRWSLKGGVPQWEMFQYSQSCSWLVFDRINLDPKIKIKYIDTKNQLADILTKGSFTRDEWNHLLCLFNISHFSSTVCSDTMAKRSQQDSGRRTSHSKIATLWGRLYQHVFCKKPLLFSSSSRYHKLGPSENAYIHCAYPNPVPLLLAEVGSVLTSLLWVSPRLCWSTFINQILSEFL